jgi:hypothetical protein
MRLKNITITPIFFVSIGVGYLIYCLFTKSLNPFVLLAWFMAAIIQFFAQKQQKISSNLVTLVVTLIIVFTLKHCIIDFVVWNNKINIPAIPNNSRIFFRPAFFTLRQGDLIVYRSNPYQKIGKIQNINNGTIEIQKIDKDELIKIDNSLIKGKVIYILK